MPSSLQRIHLDPIGGIAGDMFVAAVVDTFPDLAPGLLEELDKLPLPDTIDVRIVEHRDTVLRGRRFDVDAPHVDNDHAHPHGDHGARHTHVSYRSIVALLREAPLRESVRERACALFASLADAEAQVHGIETDKVVFHELGAWDSIVDFVAAAYLIDALGSVRWTCSAVPMGRGRVRTQHGILPVPAPATTLLLRGFQVVDDGVEGERVTPTGAAILKHLVGGDTSSATGRLVVGATGNGFGSKTFAEFSNVLRCIAFTASESEAVMDEDVSVATFEVDDQTPEDLATALDTIRKASGVLDVFQTPVFGKKGRILVQVQVLMRPDSEGSIVDLCFTETSTLGLRLASSTRKLVRRSVVSLQEPAVRVKLADRPQGRVSAKAEMDDLAAVAGGKAVRDDVRRTAEAKALDRGRDE
jgi:pyridinium-3,5-bisthiocarboxylic acid mononucleotide nickel chelatase